MKYNLTSFLTLSTILLAPFVSNANIDGRSTVVAPIPPPYVLPGSSEYHRVGKKFVATLTGLGSNPGYASARTLSGGYYINKDQLLLLEINSGEGLLKTTYSSFSSNGFTTENTAGQSETQIRQIGAHFKQFLGNSFYVRGGIDYSQVDYELNYDWAGGTSEDHRSSFSGESFIGSVVIGNQWQWQNLTLGADWIGLTSVLSSKIKSESLTGNPNENDKKRFQEYKEDYLNDGGTVALRFYVGASF